jgi:hypothetical protein
MQRRLPALLAALTIAMSQSGCLYDSPLTSAPSTNIDTRLLGVFEFDENYDERSSRKRGEEAGEEEAREEKRKVMRVAILPLDEDHYRILYRDLSKKPLRTLEFRGWISRVDEDYYLTLEDTTEGSPTFGKYAWVKFGWRWPGDFYVSTPDIAGFENVTPYEMRKAVRLKRNGGTLFPFASTYWRKLDRIWWDWRGKTPPQDEIPKAFETGESNYP